MTRYALWAVAGIAVLGVVGALHATDAISVPLFDLDKEGTVPQAYSGLLLLVATGAAYVAAQSGAPGRRALLLIAAVLAYMSFDEMFRFHEELDAAVQFDWQVLYVPILVVALVGWVGVERVLRGRRVDHTLWIGGAGCWVVAQALEALQWSGHVRPGSIEGKGLSGVQLEHELSQASYLVKMIPEEILEMAGSFLFALVLARLAARYAGRSGDGRNAYLPAS
jgi:hypothetical protein